MVQIAEGSRSRRIDSLAVICVCVSNGRRKYEQNKLQSPVGNDGDKKKAGTHFCLVFTCTAVKSSNDGEVRQVCGLSKSVCLEITFESRDPINRSRLNFVGRESHKAHPK